MGRPPGSKNRPKDGDVPISDNAEEKAPPKRQTRRGSSRKSDIALAVGALNDLLVSFPALRDDALTEQEGELLVTGIDRAQQQSPTLQKYFRAAATASGWIALAYAATIIALPRLARHDMLPRSFSEKLQTLVEKANKQQDVQTAPQNPTNVSHDVFGTIPRIPPMYAADGIDYDHTNGMAENVREHVASG